MRQQWLTADTVAVTAVLTLIAPLCQAGLLGRIDTLVTLDNRQFHPLSSVEEQLDLNYEQPSLGLRSGLSLSMRQREGGYDTQLYQLYLEKRLNSNGDSLQLGRFQNADTLGFYTLDGARYRLNKGETTLLFHAGVPRRIESLYAIEGDALYGVDLYVHDQQSHGFQLDGHVGWQLLKQQAKTSDRLSVGLRGLKLDPNASNRKNRPAAPFTFSLAGTYLVDENYWQAFQLNTRATIAADRYVRLDYETYEPDEDAPTFRERFYSLYGRERQTQFKGGYQFKTHSIYNWNLSGRHIVKELGDNGYGAALGWSHRSDRGLQIEAQLDHLAISDDSASSFYIETKKALAPKMRGMLGAVLQHQQKRLTGDNQAVGFELQLERLFRISTLPSDLLFTTQLSQIWNSHQQNEYRIAVSLSYRFTDPGRSTAP